MARTEQQPESDHRGQLAITLDCTAPREIKPLLRVAAVEKLHLTVDGRSLCGLLTIDELDVYDDAVGLRAWNDGPLEHCAQCRTALVTRIRRPANMDVHHPHSRTGRSERPVLAETSYSTDGRGA
jgi:hypothetical protein